MKPLEFMFRRNGHGILKMVVFYDNGKSDDFTIEAIPTGLELGKHYSIADIYGYKVKDDREGL